MQDPQSYEDDAGNVYVREGNRFRVIRAGQPSGPSPAPSGASPIPGLIQMETRQQRAQAEERLYDRERDAERDARMDRTEARAVETQARQASAEERAAAAAEMSNKGGSAELRGRLNFGLPVATRAEERIQGIEAQGGNPLNRDWGAAALDAIPDWGLLNSAARLWGGRDYQAYDQASASVEAALLPIFSGMAVTDSEAQRFIRANLPRLGDDEATLAEKSRNRSEVLNAGAYLMNRDLPFPEVGIYGLVGAEKAQAQPALTPGTYAEDRAGRSDDDLAAQGYQEVEPGVRRRQRTAEEMEAAGYRWNGSGWIPPGGGEPLAPGATMPSDGPSGGNPQSGIEQADQNARARLPGPIRALADGYRNLEAFAQSAAEQIPGLDEAAAWTAAKLSDVPYSEARQVQREVSDYDRDNYGAARNIGGVTGAVAPLAIGAGAPIRVLQGGGRLVNATNAAVGAATYGAAVGAGQGDGSLSERGGNALAGAAFGAAAGPLAQPVANALGRTVVQPLARGVQATGRFAGRQLANVMGDSAPIAVREATQANPLASGLDRFADRMGAERVNALAPRAASRRDLGIDATLIDTLDDASVGRLRALATRDTPARDMAVRFSEGRRANLPSRVSRIAREEISDDARPAMDIIKAQKDTRRANASTIQTFANDVVPVSEDLIAALRSDFVKPQLRAAAQRAQGSINPAEREAANRLNQLADTALDNPNGVQLTVREAQDVSRALHEAADAAFRSGSPDGPVLKELANAVRGSARDSSKGYSAWLKQYGEDSDLIEAATTGRNFVSVSTDPVNARSTEAFVRNAEEAPEAGREIMRAASREAVEASASNPGTARTTLDRFASDVDQGRRAQAIGVNAERLSARSQAELDALTAAQRASPRAGSETSTNLQDAGGAAGMVVNAVRNPVSTAFGAVVSRITSRGFSDAEAEAIVAAAQNAGRTDELIGMLAQRMNRREARNMARAIRYQVATSPQSAQQQ